MGGLGEEAVYGVGKLSFGVSAGKRTKDRFWRCCKCPRYGSYCLTMRAGSTFSGACRAAGKACSICPLSHFCNGIDVWRHALQTVKSDRVKSPGEKTFNRPPKVENPSLSRADNGNSGGPTGPPAPPTEFTSGEWTEQRVREGRFRPAAQPSSLSYAAAL